MAKLCGVCRKEFEPSHTTTKFCCYECRSEGYRRSKPKSTKSGTGDIGAAHELIVCADLLKKGYSVFRAQSPNCPCDLMLLNSDGRAIRVEVTTGRILSDGGVRSITKDNNRFDVLAIVTHDWRIFYRDPKGADISSF